MSWKPKQNRKYVELESNCRMTNRTVFKLCLEIIQIQIKPDFTRSHPCHDLLANSNWGLFKIAQRMILFETQKSVLQISKNFIT